MHGAVVHYTNIHQEHMYCTVLQVTSNVIHIAQYSSKSMRFPIISVSTRMLRGSYSKYVGEACTAEYLKELFLQYKL